MDAILFRVCLGLNDSRGVATQTMITNPQAKGAGSVELIDCLNLTTTSDGCVEKIAPLVTAITHTAPVTRISAGKRFMFSDGVDTREWTTGTTVVNRFPAVSGPIAHTPLDVRVSTGTNVYKSKTSPAGAMAEALVGVYSGPPVPTPFYGMAPFNQAFMYGAKVYTINHEDPRFLGYSEDYAYDLWNRGSGHIGHINPVLQAGAIPGCILTVQSGGVTAYLGGSPGPSMAKRHYSCPVIPGTLYSGPTKRTMGGNDGAPVTADADAHVFLCSDGVYTIDQSGVLTNLTDSRTSNLGGLNTSYTCATVAGDKYLAFGNNCCIEYDFQTKAVMKLASFGVVDATVWSGTNYFAAGSTISALSTEIDTGSTFGCSLTLPLSDLGTPGAKSLESLYFTGEIGDGALITATDSTGKAWEKEVADIGQVTNYRIKTPKGMLGNYISLKIECQSGSFRMEELRAVLSASKRSR